MKKILYILFAFILLTMNQSFAVNYGYYKSDTEYGLIDAFKFNGFNREGKKFIELKNQEELNKRMQRETKAHDNTNIDENRQFQMMKDGTIAM